MMKGKGKGYYPKGGYGTSPYGFKGGTKGGKGKGLNPGWNPGKGGKGWYDPYQQKGKGKGTQGNWYNCGEPGHPAGLSPHPPKGTGKGKGIKGACWNCGEQGHRAEDCPSISKGRNHIGAGMSFGGGEGDSDSGLGEGAPSRKTASTRITRRMGPRQLEQHGSIL